MDPSSIAGAVIGVVTAAGGIYAARQARKSAESSDYVKMRAEDRRQFQTLIADVRAELADARVEVRVARQESADLKHELREAEAHIVAQEARIRDAIGYIGDLRSIMRREGYSLPPAPDSLALPRWEERS